MTDWRTRLRACRQNLGSRTGEFWKENRRHLEIPAHERLKRGDALDQQWKDQELLFTRGDVHFAAVVMANQNLFRRAWVGAPALVVHGPDPHFEQHPETLEAIAQDVYALKATEPEEMDFEELEPLAEKLRDELTRFSWVRLPGPLAAGRECYLTTVFLHRDALPGGWLAGAMLPVLTLKDGSPSITALPARYWPDEFAHEWRAREPTGAECDERPTVVVEGYGWPVPVIFVASAMATQLLVGAATGDMDDYSEHIWPMAIGFSVAGAAIWFFDRHEGRPATPRYFAPTCGHPIDVRYDRRFFWISPRIWAYGLLAGGIALFIAAAVR